MPWTALCELNELKPGEGKYVSIDGFRLAVFLHEDKPHVLDDTCPHAGGPISGGYVDEGCAVCPWHYWCFDLNDGKLRGAPGVAVKTYPARIYDFNGRTLVQADLPSPRTAIL